MLSTTSAIPFGVHSGRPPEQGLLHCLRSQEWRDHISISDVVGSDAYFSHGAVTTNLVWHKEQHRSKGGNKLKMLSQNGKTFILLHFGYKL